MTADHPMPPRFPGQTSNRPNRYRDEEPVADAAGDSALVIGLVLGGVLVLLLCAGGGFFFFFLLGRDGAEAVGHGGKMEVGPKVLAVPAPVEGENTKAVIKAKVELLELGENQALVGPIAPLMQSLPPGVTWTHQIKGLEQAGKVEYSLQTAPRGMSISPQGLLTWQVPFDFPEGEVAVILSARVPQAPDPDREYRVPFRLLVSKGKGKP